MRAAIDCLRLIADEHEFAQSETACFQLGLGDELMCWPDGERTFLPERGVSINGEAQEGARPPYWVILASRRGKDGTVICSEGYAHAL